jgi:hypothetical protein
MGAEKLLTAAGGQADIYVLMYTAVRHCGESSTLAETSVSVKKCRSKTQIRAMHDERHGVVVSPE